MKIALRQHQKLIYHHCLLRSINVNVRNVIANWLKYFNLEIRFVV